MTMARVPGTLRKQGLIGILPHHRTCHGAQRLAGFEHVETDRPEFRGEPERLQGGRNHSWLANPTQPDASG